MVELCSLIICSCIPSFRQVAARIPGLNSVLGLSSNEHSKTYYANALSIPLQLQSRPRKEYIQSQKSKALWSQTRPSAFGMTVRATGAAGMDEISENGSQDEIFPHKSDQTGVILVTTEVQHTIESAAESAVGFTETSVQFNKETTNDTIEEPDPIAPAKKSSENWLRLSR